ncbi:MAG: hypothetical protein QM648_07965 [Solirubrobacterales bacterium]
MAQTKKKRQTKHRGDQAGRVETRGRTSRPTSRAQARQQAMQRNSSKRVERASRPPTWQGASTRAAIAAAVFFVMLLVLKQPIGGAVAVAVLMFAVYIPMGYYMDKFLYDRRVRKDAEAAAQRKADKAAKKAE